MKTTLVKIVAVTCCFLCATPFRCLARSDDQWTAAYTDTTTTGFHSNVAEAALERALARTVAVVFPPPEWISATEPKFLTNGAVSIDFSQEGTPSQGKTPSTGTAQEPSLPDLFPSGQTQGNAREQALLDKRSHMLKIHQRLGLITAIPMVAALITGPQAKAKGKDGQTVTEPTPANLDLHIALGGLTTGLCFTTAYYAIFAPKVSGVKPRGAIRLHRDLAWIHGSGMILTAVLGMMAYKQENAGEKVHGIASAHGAVAYTTAAAYGASIVAVSWPIHWKFWR